MSEFRPRPGQKEVLDYTAGKMGISAVPGSGKTHTLAELAARLVARHIDDDQEVLVVTLVNSAVNNFKSRINALSKERNLLPSFGYRVRTLHGLAHDIVRERPGLVGLADDFAIIDERAAEAARDDAVETWLRAHPDAADPYLSLDLEGRRAEWIKRAQWPVLIRDAAGAFIRLAKDHQLTPDILLERLDALPDPGQAPLARMGTEIYVDYQRSLAYRGVVDFDDLIRLALVSLLRAPDYLARLQQRWPYILEDEAQDSSHVQEQILRLLVGEQGNWVRVGDTNQAIYETFTTANPEFLRAFLQKPDVQEVSLAQSGRSQQAIIDLANHLLDWTLDEHPEPSARAQIVDNRQVGGAFYRLHILPTGPGDHQPNPDPDPTAVQIIDREFTPDGELQAIANLLKRWHNAQLKKAQADQETCAVLVPRARRAVKLINLLKALDIPHVELLRSTRTTRETAGSLTLVLRSLADPTSSRKLSKAFEVWRRHDRDDPEAKALMETAARRITACPAVEAYLWPRADHDWLAPLTTELPADELALLIGFREVARRWQRAAILPIDQLMLTLASELFDNPSKLAIAYKLATEVRRRAETHLTYRLSELIEELETIARNERRFLGFASEEADLKPPKGQVTVATMHKAKGLEWDRVYLMSVNNFNFPAGLSHDTYQDEKWFLRGNLNLKAQALAQLEPLAQSPIPGSDSGTGHWNADAGSAATRTARLAYISERLRLLYVGITRARCDLIITWNTGNRPSEKLQPAAPFIELQDYWESRG
jgi:DNA helicase-2/ATP-dependent DNA helicase PcrA